MNTEYLKDILKKITDRMLLSRPMKTVEYKPFVKNSAVTYNFRTSIKVDLHDMFPDAEKDDFAFVSTALKIPKDSEISLLAKGKCEIYHKGNLVGSIDENTDSFKVFNIKAKKGYNIVEFKTICDGDDFSIEFKACHPKYHSIWATDYLLWIRATIPLNGFEGEEGLAISKLYRKTENIDEPEYVFPTECDDDEIADFNNLYESGEYAASVSWAKCESVINIKTENEIRIWVNNEECFQSKIPVNVGDRILILTKKGKSWGFESDNNNNMHIPFLVTSRKKGVHWLHLGAVQSDFSPKDLQFTHPYRSEDGKQCFWRFKCKDMFVRPYIDSVFYSQWLYALMVGHYGILRASEIYKEYYEYFRSSLLNMATYFDYINFERSYFGNPTFMPRASDLCNLDMIGAVGMMLCELYLREKDETAKKNILHVIKIMEEALFKVTPRMPDGAFYRIDTMWADDTFMSCPFLVRLASIMNKPEYYDEVVKQLLLYKERLYMEDENVFSHIFFPKEGCMNRVPWGRGNGWVFFTLCDVYEHLPDNTDGKEQIKKIINDFAYGLKHLQSETGMWRQVLDIKKSYKETSGSAIFILGMIKAVRMGILPQDYISCAEKALVDLLNTMIDDDGNVNGICMGSECSMNPEYYCKLATISNDDHGTGVVISAICEMIIFLS